MSEKYSRTFQREELDNDRRRERRLIWKALFAAAVVAALIVVRAVYFL